MPEKRGSAGVWFTYSSMVVYDATFDAASVKPRNPDAPDRRLSFQHNPRAVRITNEQLNFLIPYASKIAVYQITGGPALAGLQQIRYRRQGVGGLIRIPTEIDASGTPRTTIKGEISSRAEGNSAVCS